jgi:hypothetical protein
VDLAALTALAPAGEMVEDLGVPAADESVVEIEKDSQSVFHGGQRRSGDGSQALLEAPRRTEMERTSRT